MSAWLHTLRRHRQEGPVTTARSLLRVDAIPITPSGYARTARSWWTTILPTSRRQFCNDGKKAQRRPLQSGWGEQQVWGVLGSWKVRMIQHDLLGQGPRSSWLIIRMSSASEGYMHS